MDKELTAYYTKMVADTAAETAKNAPKLSALFVCTSPKFWIAIRKASLGVHTP